MSDEKRPRIAVIGHAEHVTIARVAAIPQPGEILHLADSVAIAGGGGAIAFHQLAKSGGEIHFFTVLGNDDAAREVEASLAATGAHIHAARRDHAQTRDIVLVTAGGERTIVVVGEPLHARLDDNLPWWLLAECDAVYFTAQDPEILKVARGAPMLVVTARRRGALERSGVRADVVIGSNRDPREASTRADYAVPPEMLVMTEGADGGVIETSDSMTRFDAPQVEAPIGGSYGAGDSFAGALTWYLASGLSIEEACARAAVAATAVLRGINPLESQTALS